MTPNQIIILNFEEIRRRSLKLWQGITPEMYFWKPDEDAMHTLESVRHILESEHLFHTIVNNRGNLGDYPSPWLNRPYTNIQDEIDFTASFRAKFIETIQSFSEDELENSEIIRSEVGQRRKLGDYLNRIAYHEAIHTGQLLSYMRTFGVDRPIIWD
jgi:uncharacterized damage-inducible protein DinB